MKNLFANEVNVCYLESCAHKFLNCNKKIKKIKKNNNNNNNNSGFLYSAHIHHSVTLKVSYSISCNVCETMFE